MFKRSCHEGKNVSVIVLQHLLERKMLLQNSWFISLSSKELQTMTFQKLHVIGRAVQKAKKVKIPIITVAQQEMKRVQKCMRRKIAHANKTGTIPNVIGEQYIEYPRALCDIDGLPVKGQKSLATKLISFKQGTMMPILSLIPSHPVGSQMQQF